MNGQRGAVSVVLAAVLAAAALGGAGVGVALEQTGVIGGSDSSSTVAGVQTATYYECPDGAAAGSFHSGDRVLVTGRDRASAWVEVRSPADLGVRVWVPVAVVSPDADLADVPVHPCTPTVAAPSATTTTTTTTTTPVTEDDPAVTAPGATTPAGGGSTGGVSTGGGSAGGGSTGGGAPPPGDTAGPQIAQAFLNPPNLSERPPSGVCQGGGPVVAKVSAIVVDPSGVASVTVSWDGAEGGSRPMTGSGTTYDGTVGPFSQGLVGFTPPSIALTVTITARDNAGNTSSFPLTLTVGNCLGN